MGYEKYTMNDGMSSRMEREMLKDKTRDSGNQFHGSDLEAVARAYGLKKEEITSFSANVNPLGLSPVCREGLSRRVDVISSYPDRTYTGLREAIAAYCHTNKESILVGNGSTELISLMIRLRRPRTALLLEPAYSEYEREIRLAGGSCRYLPLREEAGFALQEEELAAALENHIDLLMLCNPNNPTSTIVNAAQMERILSLCKRLGVFVIVDETYIEFAPDWENATSIPLTKAYENLVVLRGVSKFFAAPGLRLGYAVMGDASLLRAALEEQNPWTVSSLADEAGRLLFSDTAYIRQTRALIDCERQKIWQALCHMESIKPYYPHANFILARLLNPSQRAGGLFHMAIRRGMMIRDCSSFPCLDGQYFRFCFMLPDDNDRLLTCIREFLEMGQR